MWGLGGLGVQMRAGHGRGGIRGTMTAPAAAELQPQLHPHSPGIQPLLSHSSQGLARLLPRAGCTGTAAELEAAAPHSPLAGSHPSRL